MVREGPPEALTSGRDLEGGCLPEGTSRAKAPRLILLGPFTFFPVKKHFSWNDKKMLLTDPFFCVFCFSRLCFVSCYREGKKSICD